MINVSERRLPPELADLPCTRAEIAYEVAPGGPMPSLEGPVFDREGNFYCCHTAPGDTSVIKITPEGEQSEFYHNDTGMTVGLAFHKDSRCFATDMLSSCIDILSPEGELLDTLFVETDGRKMRPDCLVFRENGDLCFTDLSGHLHDPSGGVYVLRAASGYREMELFLGEPVHPMASRLRLMVALCGLRRLPPTPLPGFCWTPRAIQESRNTLRYAFAATPAPLMSTPMPWTKTGLST